MSFKRDGDDQSLLSNLRKRRVDELFAESIPEDEAFLMSSGRFACTVCNHRPVFDTINMLAIHRAGKKHVASAEYHKVKKGELEELIWTRRHEMFLKNGSTELAMPSSSRGGLLTAGPYDARAKRPKVKPYDRKVRLCLDGPAPPGATSVDSLPEHSKSPMIHSHKLCDIFREKSKEIETPDKPYAKKGGKDTQANGTCIKKTLTSTNIQQNVPSTGQVNTLTSYLPAHYLPLLSLPPPPPPATEHPEMGGVLSSSSQIITEKTKQKGSNKAEKNRSVAETGSKQKLVEQRLRTEEYLKLTESGWKKDWTGNWIKDENVEFDSDEDIPTV